MPHEICRYVGRTVELTYIDRHNNITQRCVRVVSVTDDVARVFCFERQQPRALGLDNILAVMPAGSRVG